MIRVLSDDATYEIGCEYCGADLEFTEADAKKNESGHYYIECPVCVKKVYLNEIPDFEKKITVNDVTFPTDFYPFGDGTKLSDSEVNNFIRYCINKLISDEAEEYTEIATGDTKVIARKFDDEIEVTVAKGYYEVSVPIND